MALTLVHFSRLEMVALYASAKLINAFHKKPAENKRQKDRNDARVIDNQGITVRYQGQICQRRFQPKHMSVSKANKPELMALPNPYYEGLKMPQLPLYLVLGSSE